MQSTTTPALPIGRAKARADGFTSANIGALLLASGCSGLGIGVAAFGLLAASFFFLMRGRGATHRT